MTEEETQATPDPIQRSVRLVSLLAHCRTTGLVPTPVSAIHALAYLADALGPIWALPALDAQLLKRGLNPFFPGLQTDLDILVGRGVVGVESFSYEIDHQGYRLAASYYLTPHAEPILQAIEQMPGQRRLHSFVREVVYAAAGLGTLGLDSIGRIDVAYADPNVDQGGLLNIEDEAGMNATAALALRFNDLPGFRRFDEAQLVHLYLRHLYGGLHVA